MNYVRLHLANRASEHCRLEATTRLILSHAHHMGQLTQPSTHRIVNRRTQHTNHVLEAIPVEATEQIFKSGLHTALPKSPDEVQHANGLHLCERLLSESDCQRDPVFMLIDRETCDAITPGRGNTTRRRHNRLWCRI